MTPSRSSTGERIPLALSQLNTRWNDIDLYYMTNFFRAYVLVVLYMNSFLLLASAGVSTYA